MTLLHAPRATRALMLLIVTSLSACASPPLAVTPDQTPPPASLLNDSSQSVEQHSKKVQDWLSKVRALFESWDAPTKGCAATQPKSAGCS